MEALQWDALEDSAFERGFMPAILKDTAALDD
jgi:hypothetical protein